MPRRSLSHGAFLLFPEGIMTKRKNTGVARARKSARGAVLDWHKALIEALNRSDISDGERVTRLAAVADACVAAAMQGNVQAIREIAARLEAKTAEEKPSAIRIVHTFKSPL
jgi:hypothetical protein